MQGVQRVGRVCQVIDSPKSANFAGRGGTRILQKNASAVREAPSNFQLPDIGPSSGNFFFQ